MLKDLWEYLNRYIYLPRLKNQAVLVKTVQAAVSGMFPGPFAYAEQWDEQANAYRGVTIKKANNPVVVVDSESVIVKPDVAEAHRPEPKEHEAVPTNEAGQPINAGEAAPGDAEEAAKPEAGKNPTRFMGTVMISPDRPAREIHQIVEAIIEQLTTIPGSDVSLKLEIDAEVPGGLDKAKVRTLLENANTLGFIDKTVQ